MKDRSHFPTVFWVANLVEVLERFAYYGIFVGFVIYMTMVLKYDVTQSGTVQRVF